jgi:hypothetical protein
MAGDSYVLPDGRSRAPAVTLHCASGAGTAVACGTAAQPLVVTPSPGAATAANQASEITALGSGVPAIPVAGQPLSRTLSNAPASTSTTLFPANPSRRYMAFQAPQTSFIWVNFMGGVAAPNAPDCAYFPAGSLYESGQFVTSGAITVYSPVVATISAWEG